MANFSDSLEILNIKSNIRSIYKEKDWSHFYKDDRQTGVLLGDPEVTANIHCKSRNLPNTDTQNCSTDLR